MSLRLEMLQVARLAPNLLQEASSPVAKYLLSQFNDDGGAADRAGCGGEAKAVGGMDHRARRRTPRVIVS